MGKLELYRVGYLALEAHHFLYSFMGFFVFFLGASCTAGTLKWIRHKVLWPREIISMVRDILGKWDVTQGLRGTGAG